MSHDLACWGSTEFGQDGHGITNVEAVPFHKGLVADGGLKGRIKTVACGSSHTVVVTDSDEIYTWGNGSSGQIASPDMFNHRTPVKVTLDPSIPDDVTISQVKCGMRHTMVLVSNGQVYAFGNNSFAQLGYDFQTENFKENQVKPLLLKTVLPKSVKQVSCGDKHSLFLFVDGSMAAVGNNSHGQLGDGTRKESVAPRLVDLDCCVQQIASGSNHNLAISGVDSVNGLPPFMSSAIVASSGSERVVLIDSRPGAGDVYVWGFGKGCGHRRHDVLGPELKLLGHDIVRVTGGGFHSMALANSGDVYVWGFGTDGQLGLGDRVVTSAAPKRLRHKGVRGCVSDIDCGEFYSAAVTRDGLLYMWGRNSHCIEATESNKKPYFKPVCVNPNSEHSSVHSVHCGTRHAVVLLGTPDWTPDHNDNVDDGESDDDDDDIHDDNMTSDGSESTRSSLDEKNLKKQDDIGDDYTRLDETSAPGHHTGVNKATSPPHSLDDQSPPLFPSRTQTKLTIGEFYALTDSSPTESKNTTPKSSPSPSMNAPGTKRATSQSPISPRKEQQWQQHHHQQHNEHQNNEIMKPTMVLKASKRQIDDKENNIQATNSPRSQIVTCPEVHVSSPSSSPDFSVISESSLKKRMAENVHLNKGINFKSRDWSGHRRGHNLMSPLKPIDMTPSPDHDSPLGKLTPRASCRSKAASLTERSHTMFISKSTADNFILPREQSFISKQSMSLMDLGNLRSGAVFENHDNNNNNESNSSSRDTSAGHFHSNASSRLSMVSPYNENDLKEIISHKSPDKRKLDAIQSMLSMSDTPSNMMRYNRMKDMSGLDQNMDNPLKPTHVLFATPSPNFGVDHIMDNGDFKSGVDMPRPRTLYGLPHNKHYRKPGLPGVDVKTKVIRPGHLHGPSLHGADGFFPSGKKDKLSELSMHRNLTTLEVTAPSTKHTATAFNSNTQPQMPTVHNNGGPDSGSSNGVGGYNPSQPFVNLTPRRALHPPGSLWRTRTMTQNPIMKPADMAIDIGAFTSDGASFRKDIPPSIRSFHKKNNNSSGKNLIKMKKNIFYEKAQTSLAISGAGTAGPKGQYLRQVNTSASSRNHKKT